MEEIPVMRPRMPQREKIEFYLSKILSSGTFSNFGPQVRALEDRFSKFLGVDPEQVVVMSSATQAIAGAVATFGIREWVAPSWTFTASIAGIMHGGGQPRFIDIADDSHWVKSPDHLTSSIGLLTVAPFGLSPSAAVKRLDGGPHIIDAAASLASSEAAEVSLQSSEALVFSLHATKPLGIGEGGLLVAADPSFARAVRSWSNFGFDGERESTSVGTNAKLSEFSAAVGHAVLDMWWKEKDEWLAAREAFRSAVDDFGFDVLDPGGDFISPYGIVDFPTARMAEVVEQHLHARGVQTRRWWGTGCHTMRAYHALEVPRTGLPNTSSLSARSVGLPLYRGFSGGEAERLAELLDYSVNAYSNGAML